MHGREQERRIYIAPHYRSSRHPWNGHSVGDDPVVVREGSDVWIGPSAGVKVRFGRESLHVIQIGVHGTDLQPEKYMCRAVKQ